MIRILVADDQELVRRGVCQLLDSLPEFQVVGRAVDGAQALELVQALSPDVLLVDISMPGKSGLDVIREVGRMGLSVRSVVLSMHRREAYLQQAFEGGASGYLLKAGPAADLAAAIRAVHRGDFFISPRDFAMTMGAFLDQLTAQAAGAGQRLLLGAGTAASAPGGQ